MKFVFQFETAFQKRDAFLKAWELARNRGADIPPAGKSYTKLCTKVHADDYEVLKNFCEKLVDSSVK